ncbi:hypothetical protein ABT084_36085 [Streptomyces sp. NPDC002138]|uniref:hypothetical protein n=1 Tax=Streptomyces sp. NPDC002138 TaxID=3154410 RepID=UPI0033193191
MSAATRCFLALTVLLACGVSALAVQDTAGGHRAGSATVTTRAAELMDTSWGDEHVPRRY